MIDISELKEYEEGAPLRERALYVIDSRRAKLAREKLDAGVGATEPESEAGGVGATELGIAARHMGAGMLVQAALIGCAPMVYGDVPGADDYIRMLEEMGAPVEVSYVFGEKGKPYLVPNAEVVNSADDTADGNGPAAPADDTTTDALPFISISHSGDYVICAVSDREVGADIQKLEDNADLVKMAERYFAPEEAEEVEERGRMRFYRLWCRKEALGKCEGTGALPYLSKDMRNFKKDYPGYEWTEKNEPEGYMICVAERR